MGTTIALTLLLVGKLVAATTTFNPIPFSPGFNITAVSALAKSLPSHSWEFGTAAEALLELHNPELSVFGASPFPSLSYASSKIVIGTGANGLSDGDGAVGDPASLGVSAILLGKIRGNSAYREAAAEEVDFIVNKAPRWSNGAISQRVDVAELWADFVYMAPPFLAYYAVATSDINLLRLTVTQCGLYRQVLRSNTTASYKGLWTHIQGPQSADPGLWSTGNAWAAAGMTRVLATVLKAPIAHEPKNRVWQSTAVLQLNTWIKEILDGAMHAPADDGLLRNYLNDTSGDGHGFGEISGSSLLAATAYRVALMQPKVFGTKYINWADGIRGTLSRGHVESDGRVVPAVNPLGWGDTTPYTNGSPEGQNFVVLMYAAWRDCIWVGKCRR
ncbi:Six-hairpin glycosidase-like protein [Crucibulum laeve]|uniref:Six-hairpin glycosidase-like protein n=1 Tax=Crucibulum laeve TaxID=68775 RepID=A0A5C3LMN7_9AGAR|nr:Six-hairpin glycosidase-like protein [Crucibulum laeve]